MNKSSINRIQRVRFMKTFCSISSKLRLEFGIGANWKMRIILIKNSQPIAQKAVFDDAIVGM